MSVNDHMLGARTGNPVRGSIWSLSTVKRECASFCKTKYKINHKLENRRYILPNINKIENAELWSLVRLKNTKREVRETWGKSKGDHWRAEQKMPAVNKLRRTQRHSREAVVGTQRKLQVRACFQWQRSKRGLWALTQQTALPQAYTPNLKPVILQMSIWTVKCLHFIVCPVLVGRCYWTPRLPLRCAPHHEVAIS